MDLELAGRVAIVTAGSRGIGRAIADELAREGVDVAVCLGDPRLTEHLVEQARRDVPSHLMAQAYLEDLPARQGLLPRLVLLAPDKLEAGAPQDHPELAVGGRRHLGVEEAARSPRSGIDAEGVNVRHVGGAIGTLAEAVELGGVLLRVVECHLDQIGERRIRCGALGRKI